MYPTFLIRSKNPSCNVYVCSCNVVNALQVRRRLLIDADFHLYYNV